jgi:arabinoxylan arabinofuranohydrolase
MNHRIVVVATSASLVFLALTSGCNIIKPDLLSDASGAPEDARGLDAPPDAYVPSVGNLVGNPGLESEGMMGWVNNGGGTLTVATDTAHTGTKSLLMSARAGVWNGPAVALTAKVRPGKHYSMAVWARLAAAGTDTFEVSMRHICAEDGQHFNQMTTRTAAPAADNATWVQPTGSFFVTDSPSCTLIEVLVYVETTTNKVDFYVDDLDVQEIAP